MENNSTLQPEQSVSSPSMISDSAWTSFQSILLFISLGFFAGSLHSLWSLFINYWIPTTTYGYSYSPFISPEVINYALSALIVSGPLFILLFLLTNKRFIKQPELKKLHSKKVFNYFILVITFVILIVRTIAAINTALNDKFTSNFVYNLIVTFLIVGSIFAYYLYEVRLEKHPAAFSMYLLGASSVFLVAVVTFFVALGINTDLVQKESDRAHRYNFEADTPTPNAPEQPFVPANPRANENITEESVLAVATNLPSSAQTIQGIDFSVEKARIYKESSGMVLEVTLNFAANKPCTLTGGAVCGVNALGIKGTDADGFSLERKISNKAGILRDSILDQGEKIRGNYYFILNELGEKYYVSYNDSTGAKSKAVAIVMQRADVDANVGD